MELTLKMVTTIALALISISTTAATSSAPSQAFFRPSRQFSAIGWGESVLGRHHSADFKGITQFGDECQLTVSEHTNGYSFVLLTPNEKRWPEHAIFVGPNTFDLPRKKRNEINIGDLSNREAYISITVRNDLSPMAIVGWEPDSGPSGGHSIECPICPMCGRQ